MLCFSSIPVFLRHLTGYLDCWTVNAVRYATAAAFWLPFVIHFSSARAARAGSEPPRRSIWLAALVPTSANLLGQVGWAVCPYYVDASTIGFVIRVSFLFTIVLGFLVIPAERPLARRPIFFAGAATCLGGILLMYAERLWAGPAAATAETTGLIIVVATAACWSAYAVAVRRFLKGYRLRLAFGVISLYTAAVLLVLMLIFGEYGRLADVPPREWMLLIVSGMLGIAFGHIFYHRGIHGVGPVVASGVTLIGPFLTYAAATVFLGETMTALQLCGGLTVVAGGFALVRAKAKAGA